MPQWPITDVCDNSPLRTFALASAEPCYSQQQPSASTTRRCCSQVVFCMQCTSRLPSCFKWLQQYCSCVSDNNSMITPLVPQQHRTPSRVKGFCPARHWKELAVLSGCSTEWVYPASWQPACPYMGALPVQLLVQLCQFPRDDGLSCGT
jgi:hypothetical protein